MANNDWKNTPDAVTGQLPGPPPRPPAIEPGNAVSASNHPDVCAEYAAATLAQFRRDMAASDRNVVGYGIAPRPLPVADRPPQAGAPAPKIEPAPSSPKVDRADKQPGGTGLGKGG